MLLSLMSLPPGTPRPSELDFFLSLLHHFQSGWALKWASFTWEQKEGQGVSEKKKKKKNTAYQQHKISVICHSLFVVVENASVYLEGQIMILLFLLGSQSIPPLPKDFADCPVVLVWVPLVHQCSVALTENHKCIHWSPDVILLPLKECTRKMKRYYITRFYKRSIENFDGQVAEVKDYLSRTVLISIFG